MRKQFKKIICLLSAFVFAFCPLLFSGCDTSNVDSGGTIQPTYNVTDYLSAMKVAYTPALNSSADDEITSYANEVLGLTEILAVDTLVNLLENYFKVNKKEFSYSVGGIEKTFSSPSDDLALTNQASATLNDVEFYSVNQINIDDGNGSSHNSFVGFDHAISGTSDYNRDRHNWEIFDSTYSGATVNAISNFLVSGTLGGNTLADNSVACKMMYAILKISNTFYNVSNDGFESAYKKFTDEYKQAIDSGKATIDECRQLAITSKHSGLISGENEQQSSEQRAFKQYILDYIIGEDNVKFDNAMVKTYNSTSKQYEQKGDKFIGEYYLYDNRDNEKEDDERTDMVGLLTQINKAIDEYNRTIPEDLKTPNLTYIELLEILAGKDGNRLDELHELDINLIVSSENQQTKLWQDFYNKGVIDVVYFDEQKTIPKYRVEDPEFRNYDWTVGKIVDNVLKNSEIIYNETETVTGYPTVSNVFSRDYEYSAMEISSSDLNAKYTCSLPRNAYKSILICAKDRSDKDIKNNIGYINMVLESAEGVNVDVKIFARYYRSGSGYATWSNSNELGGTLYPLVSNTLKIDGPFKTELVNGQIQDSSLEINVQDMFKTAKFNGVNNNKKFDFTYTDANQQTQTKQIYEIEPFVEGYYNTSLNKAVHASVFGLNGKTNPTYNSFTLSTGEVIYSYDSENLASESGEFGFIEILFAPSNEKAFTFGLLGYIPQNEFSL